MALSHSGNWDHAGAWSTLALAQVTTVAERLRAGGALRALPAFRQRPRDGDPAADRRRRPLRRPRAPAAEGGFVPPARRPRPHRARASPVTLFGETARMAAGPASLALDRRRAVPGVDPLRAATGGRAGALGRRVRFHPRSPRRTGARAEQIAGHDAGAAPTRFADGIARAPRRTGTCCSGCSSRTSSRSPRQSSPGSRAVRIGIVCPYSFDVPGGVQFHVRDLAEHLIGAGHEVQRARARPTTTRPLPWYVEAAGRAVPVKYNGSVARLAFGPVSARRVRRWLSEGDFDVLHLHEPVSPSLSLLALLGGHRADRRDLPHRATCARGRCRRRSRSCGRAWRRSAPASPSREDARRTLVEHFGGDAVVIPNGVVRRPVRRRRRPAEWQGTRERPTVGVRRPDRRTAQGPAGAGRRRPRGPGATAPARGSSCSGAVTATRRVEALAPQQPRRRGAARPAQRRGQGGAAASRSTSTCAPHTGGESFGIVLVEAMSAGAPVLASDLGAFRRVLDDGEFGVLFPVGEPGRLAGRAVGAARLPGGRGSGWPWPRRRPCAATTGAGSPARCSRSTRPCASAPTGWARTSAAAGLLTRWRG